MMLFPGQENDQVQQEWLDTVNDLAFEDRADDAVVIDNNYAVPIILIVSFMMKS